MQRSGGKYEPKLFYEFLTFLRPALLPCLQPVQIDGTCVENRFLDLCQFYGMETDSVTSIHQEPSETLQLVHSAAIHNQNREKDPSDEVSELY